jgi:hypothetical protein
MVFPNVLKLALFAYPWSYIERTSAMAIEKKVPIFGWPEGSNEIGCNP